eukprot:4383199-Prymnesium_polylepis.1
MHQYCNVLTHAPASDKRMIGEFFCSRELRTRAFARVACVLLVLFSVGRAALQALLVAWYGTFYDLLQSAATSSSDAALEQGRAGVYDGLLQFTRIALPWAVLAPLGALLRRHFCFAWRMALVEAYMGRWRATRRAVPEGASQRVQEDTARFSTGVELFAGKLLDGALKLFIFAPKLLRYGDVFAPPPLVPPPLRGRPWLLWLAGSLAALSWG